MSAELHAKPRCNICGGQEFIAGPNGRMADSGHPPCCRHCGALERQRIVRRVFQALPLGFLDWRRGLQFSTDTSLDPRWFRGYEVSIYEGANSLDIQDIARPDGSYDFVSFSHVLEFVPDDRRAFAELLRVLSPAGMIQACFSAPRARAVSEDYRTPFGPHEAWHLYGMDVAARFVGPATAVTVLAVEESDPCTGTHELVHLFFKQPADAMRVRAWLSAWSASAVALP
jgi:SAM-dependent methyltransferase